MADDVRTDLCNESAFAHVAAPLRSSARSVRLPGVMLAFVFVMLAASTTSAQVDPCDAALKDKEDRANPNGYRKRNDRCEGIFIQEVSATGTLLVASLTATMQGFKPDTGKPIPVEWKAPDAAKVNLRAYSLRPRLYYRMDTIQDAASAQYQWPPAILATYELKPADIGLVAWTAVTVGNRRLEPVYVPVAVRDSKDAAWPLSQRLIVVPPVDLKEIYLTLSPVDTTGAPGQPLRDGALGYGYYPAGGAVKIDLAPLPKPGIYLVQVAAERRDGASVVSRFWISQP